MSNTNSTEKSHNSTWSDQTLRDHDKIIAANNHPVLLVFDMDSTIIEKNTDIGIINLLNSRSETKIESFDYTKDWTITMREVFQSLKKLNFSVNDLKSIVETIELNEGFKEIFEFLSENKNDFESIIISGSNTLFVDWVIKKNKIDNIFTKIYSNKANICDQNLIRIDPTHAHECNTCNPCQCKRIVLKDFLAEKRKVNNIIYDSKVFIGDGENDFCPGKDFGKEDYVLGRNGFHLDLYVKKLMHEKKFGYPYNYLSWKNGHDIMKVLKRLVRK